MQRDHCCYGMSVFPFVCLTLCNGLLLEVTHLENSGYLLLFQLYDNFSSCIPGICIRIPTCLYKLEYSVEMEGISSRFPTVLYQLNIGSVFVSINTVFIKPYLVT